MITIARGGVRVSHERGARLTTRLSRRQPRSLMAGPVIFVVDDDASVRRAVRRLVSSLQYAVRTFASAEQFLAHADRGTPGCLILDMRLPGMSGLQLQTQLNAEEWRLPVIFVTANEDLRSREVALRGGAVNYLNKPFECQVLLQSVRQAMREQQ